MLVGEQWLLESGLVPPSSVDTLLGYAYMQPGVGSANLEFNFQPMNYGKNPTVTYKIGLMKSKQRSYRLVKSLMAKRSIFAKLFALVLIRFGAPVPGLIENNLRALASSYLPPNFKVEIDVE